MGQAPSLTDQIRERTKLLNRQNRQLERELTRLEREKHVVTLKVKKAAREGNRDLLDTLTTQFMVYRTNIKKLYKIQANLQNVTQKVQMLKSQVEINKAVLELTTTMKIANQQMGLPIITKILMEYETETQKSEIISERMDDMLDDEIDADEKEELVNSALEIISAELGEELKLPPSSTTSDSLLSSDFSSLHV